MLTLTSQDKMEVKERLRERGCVCAFKIILIVLYFLSFSSFSPLSPDMRLMQGDELRLRYVGRAREPWSGIGHVTKVPTSE